MASQIDFTVTHDFETSAEVVWAEMIDWPAHGEWIPATRVEVDGDDGQSVGSTFTGYTGVGPLMLVDRMRIVEIEWDEVAQYGTCVVEKLGPVLVGQAGFTVSPTGRGGSRVEWFERVTVPYVPAQLAPVISKIGAGGFSLGMRQLAKVLTKKRLPGA